MLLFASLGLVDDEGPPLTGPDMIPFEVVKKTVHVAVRKISSYNFFLPQIGTYFCQQWVLIFRAKRYLRVLIMTRGSQLQFKLKPRSEVVHFGSWAHR